MISHIYVTTANQTVDTIISNYVELYSIQNYSTVVIEPLEDKSELLVEQIVAMRSQVKYQYTHNIIVAIRSVDSSSNEVQNMLLKLLEEHQDFIHIVLIVQSINALVPPIVSRCKILYFKIDTSNVSPLQSEGDGSTLTKEVVDSFILSKLATTYKLADLSFLLKQRQLLISNNVSPHSIYDSVLIFLNKRSSINT